MCLRERDGGRGSILLMPALTLLWRPRWSRNHRDSPVSNSPGLGLKAWAATPEKKTKFKKTRENDCDKI